MRKVLFVVVLAFFAFASTTFAMTSTNYIVNWDSVNSGGDDISSSTNYIVHDTVGEQATGNSTSTSYQLDAGYRYGDTEAPILSYDIGTQENSTETAFTAFSNAGKTVTVASVVSYAAGDFIGVVENKGAAQIIAIGKITNIGGLIITVDAWDGSPTLVSAVPAGGDDFVYRLSGDAAQLGTLVTSAVATSMTHTSVFSNLENGYTVYISDDGNLRVDSSTYILNVADGSVTAGSDEYGGRVFGTNATSTGSDFAFSTSSRAIQATSTYANDDRIGLVYKASISGTTAAGSYSHAVYYTLTGNF
jgi:hypothetical protein